MASEKVEQRVSEARKNAVDVISKMIQEKGLNWVCQWDESAVLPCNGATGRRYHGSNRFHLMVISMVCGYTDNRWFTFKQAKEAGFAPRKGEVSAIVEYWKMFKGMKDADGEWTSNPDAAVKTVRYPKLMGYFNVFNAEQLVDSEGEGMPAKPTGTFIVHEGELVGVADHLKETSRCEVIENSIIGQACYVPGRDQIEMPARAGFKTMEGFVTVLAHEMTHSTMKPLERTEGAKSRFGSESYAFEELVAELGSTFVCLDLGVHRSAELETDEHFEEHAAYLQSWLKVFESNPDYLFKAAAEADKAADYILRRYNGEGDEMAGRDVA